MSTIRIGTRGSALALAQAEEVASLVKKATGHDVTVVTVSTLGDTSAAPLKDLGATGVFASALRDELHTGRIDVAVHSYKDLPTTPEPGMALVLPRREDVRDALVSRHGQELNSLPSGARIGTGSPRRAAQLLGVRPDISVVNVRGNVDSRLARVRNGEFDAIVVAYAGLRRLGKESDVTEVFPIDVMLPAPGQGALAVEYREDGPLSESLSRIDDPIAHACVTAERVLLRELEAGCTAPVGAWAEPCEVFDMIEIHLHGGVFHHTGSPVLRHSTTASLHDATRAGTTLAATLLASGAQKLLQDLGQGTAHNDEGETQ